MEQLKTVVRLEGFNQEWLEGRDLAEVQVTLGHNEMSSTCTVTIVDSGNINAQKLVKHSLTTGGIVGLVGSSSTPQTTVGLPVSANSGATPTDRASWEKAIVSECLRQGVKDRSQIAYILGTADHESTMGANLTELASGSAYQGRLGNNQPGDGERYKGRGLVQVTGKVNYQKWAKLLNIDCVNKPELLAQPQYALTTLVVGMRDGVFTGKRLGSYVGGNRQDFTGARGVVNGFVAEQVASVNQKTANYLKVVDSLMAGQGVATASLPTAKDTPTSAQTGNTANTTPTEANQSTDQPVKGNKIIVNIGETEFTYYHQSTETNHKEMTTVRGQGVRWVMNRRKRNTALEKTSLKTLATKVATAYKLKLDWQPPNDPKYNHIDATWLTDYELLLRECQYNGFFLGEASGILTVKPLTAIRDTSYYIQQGVNLISWNIKDQAVDKNSPDIGSSLLQGDNKVELDPVSGQFVQVKPDVDSKPDTAPSGKDKKAVNGEMGSADTAIADSARSRVKRVKGLPSTFTVVLSQNSLDLKPLDVVRTVDLGGVFNRVWLVDNIIHEVVQGTTTLSCFSPVEVIDDSPPPSSINGSTGNVVGGAPLTGDNQFAPPVRGYVITSRRKQRWGRFHHGYDIGTPVGVSCQASLDGVVTIAGNQRGYGLVIYLKHANGYETRYAHLSSIGVRVGQQVRRGEVIGKTGNTGIGTGAHLHWEIRLNGVSQESSATNIGRLVEGDILK